MIITGENAKLMSKGSNDNPNNAATSRAGGSSNPPAYQSIQPYAQPQVLLQTVAYRRSPARRFWKAFAMAVLIWVLVTMFAQSWYNFINWGNGFWSGEFPIPNGVVLSHCAIDEKDWSHAPHPSHSRSRFPYSSSTTFDLPLSYETLFFLARGDQTHGTVNIVTSDEVSDTARVHLTINYANKALRDRGVKVCLLEEERAIGVGYFTRRWSHHVKSGDLVAYEATVVLPASSNANTPLYIQNFKTDVTNTGHRLGDLQDLVNFSHISLKGSNSPIYVKSISADTAVFRTSNGAITGSYNASRSLELRTSNAPIQVNVNLGNEDYVSDLTLHTSNGKIDSHVRMTSAFDGGRYMVAAATSNAPLIVEIPTSPLESTLRVTASTSNGHARLSLPSTYEGQFSMTTSNGSPSISRHTVVDPAGKGRVRKVQTISLGRKTLKGSVAWSEEEGPGRVELRSSNAPVVIEF